MRSYIADGDPLKPFEIGLEPTPELWIEHMVEVFREVRRVLRDDGLLWLNLGDAYAGSHGNGYQQTMDKVNRTSGVAGNFDLGRRNGRTDAGYKPKDLMMLPARVALALQQDGWWLRSMIPWLKRNSMPESVTDRPSTSVEYVFLLTKSQRYFWDADAVRVEQPAATLDRYKKPFVDRYDKAAAGGYRGKFGGQNGVQINTNGRNLRNGDFFFQTWQGLLTEDDEPLALIVNPAPFKGSHFATFPPKLVEPMVKASTSEKGQCPTCGAPWARLTSTSYENPGNRTTNGPRSVANRDITAGFAQRLEKHSETLGWQHSCKCAPHEPVPQTVLDPFGGAGTVGLVADRLQRNAILCELSPAYTDIATTRLTNDAPMFADVDVA